MKKRLKKIMAITLIIAFLMSLTACIGKLDFGSDEEAEEVTSQPEIEVKPEEYGIQLEAYDSLEHGEATEAATELMLNSFREYMEEALADPVRQKEVTPERTKIKGGFNDYLDVCTIEADGKKMRYTMEIIGEPEENGLYPLYITLHGGGESSEAENNGEWMTMTNYYRDSVKSGIYVAVRGMEDVWNMHFIEDAFPMYDRLIEDMILLKKADPNRVYLLGFSAGGDGVYGVAPRMADRFAAVNMSSGHPNGISLLNVSNLPFEIQVGIRDYYTESAARSVRGAEFESVLNEYNEIFGCEYPHRVLVHVPEGHNYNDSFTLDDDVREQISEEELALYETYVLKDPAQFAARAEEENWLGKFLEIYESVGGNGSVMDLSYDSPAGLDEKIFECVTNDLNMEVTNEEDCNAVHYVSSFTRNPVPSGFIWDFSTRAPKRKNEAFYWLKADYSVDHGMVHALYDWEENIVYLETEDLNGEITILANPFLMDFDRPLGIVTGAGEMTVDLNADPDTVKRAISETGDLYLSWADEIKVTVGE